MNNIIDLDSQPLIATWETCVSSVGCRDQNFRPASTKLELNDNEAEQLIRDVAELKPPVFVFAGDDPLSRDGIFSLVQYAASCNLHPVMLLTPASVVTQQTIADLKSASLSRIAFTLNGADSRCHDVISGIPGSFARTLKLSSGRMNAVCPSRFIRKSVAETWLNSLPWGLCCSATELLCGAFRSLCPGRMTR